MRLKNSKFGYPYSEVFFDIYDGNYQIKKSYLSDYFEIFVIWSVPIHMFFWLLEKIFLLTVRRIWPSWISRRTPSADVA